MIRGIRKVIKTLCATSVIFMISICVWAQDEKPIILPMPEPILPGEPIWYTNTRRTIL